MGGWLVLIKRRGIYHSTLCGDDNQGCFDRLTPSLPDMYVPLFFFDTRYPKPDAPIVPRLC